MPTKPLKILIFLLIFIFIENVNAQKLYNKEVKAIIKIDNKSDFTTYSATVQNLTQSDKSLRYEFLAFKVDANNNASKSSQANRIYLKGTEKKILSSLTINNVIEGEITLVLLIYPEEDEDKTVGAIGKSRIVITSNANGLLEITGDVEQEENEDGVFLQGLVIKKVITKSGRDFHRYFYSEYFNKGIKTDKNILIKEVPGQRRSTRVFVEVDGKLVWQFFVNPKKEFLQEMAVTALDRSIRYLQQLQRTKNTQIRY